MSAPQPWFIPFLQVCIVGIFVAALFQPALVDPITNLLSFGFPKLVISFISGTIVYLATGWFLEGFEFGGIIMGILTFIFGIVVF